MCEFVRKYQEKEKKKEKEKNHLKRKKKKTHLVISCYNNAFNPIELPTGFTWTQDFVMLYPNKYRLTMLLHGGCLYYGLKSDVFEAKFGFPNPFVGFLTQIHFDHHVTIKICQFCVTNDEFTDADLLDFVEPVPFGVNYLVQQELRGAIIIYDARFLPITPVPPPNPP